MLHLHQSVTMVEIINYIDAMGLYISLYRRLPDSPRAGGWGGQSLLAEAIKGELHLIMNTHSVGTRLLLKDL